MGLETFWIGAKGDRGVITRGRIADALIAPAGSSTADGRFGQASTTTEDDNRVQYKS